MASARRGDRLCPGSGPQRRLCGWRDRAGERVMSSATDIRAVAADVLAAVRAAGRQEQFLEVVSPEEARARFSAHVDFNPQGSEAVTLSAALGRVLAADIVAPIDVPPFDRSGVDGFAVRAADTTGASDRAPKRLLLNAEVIACGHAPRLPV